MLSDDEIEFVVRMTHVGEDAVARVPLLDVLERANYHHLDDLLRVLAGDPNPDVRFQINLKRLKRGEDLEYVAHRRFFEEDRIEMLVDLLDRDLAGARVRGVDNPLQLLAERSFRQDRASHG